MVRNSQIIMFLLYTFVFPVDPTVQGMALVNVCPKTELDVIQASKRLGCGNDTYGNNQYMCVPNKEKTSLVEFCSQGVMGIREKGNCLELSEGEVIRHSCNQFSYGCPETNFYDYDIYKYPECQNINAEMQCYVLDRNCTVNSNTGEPEEESGQNNVIYYISILGSALVLIVCLIIIVLCYKWRTYIRNQRNRDRNNATNEEQKPLAGAENFKGNNIELILLDKTGSAKSATRDTILGDKTFGTPHQGSSCSETSAKRFKYNIHIFDTSGIFDTKKSDDEIKKEILQCISITSSGPHAIILVLNIAKYTKEEVKPMQHFVDIFGENILQHFIVVFTKKDDLDEEGMDFDLLNFLSSVDPTSLLTLVNKYRDRVMKFDNTLESNMRAKQVQDLLSMVFDVEKQTGGGYRNEIYKKAKKNQ